MRPREYIERSNSILQGGPRVSLSRVAGCLDYMFVLPGFRDKFPSLTSRDAGAIGRMPSHLHQPSLCHAQSSTPMGSSEFPHILSQEGQRGHICVYHRVRLITASCWTLLGPEHHIPFRISYCRKPQTLSHEPGQSQL